MTLRVHVVGYVMVLCDTLSLNDTVHVTSAVLVTLCDISSLSDTVHSPLAVLVTLCDTSTLGDTRNVTISSNIDTL